MEESVRAKAPSRVKERRQPYSQDGAAKRINKHQGLLKNDLPPTVPSQSFDGSSPVKKLFGEASKIVRIGMEKEYALLEREATLQNSNETIDNLRKNILHLQMEYEKLDQNFQREVSYRSEIVKRMDATRELVESVVQCSNVLEASLKQLENDKQKIAEFYELIYQNQKEVEENHNKTELLIKQQDEFLKTKVEEINKCQENILSHNSEAISQLSQKLNHANNKLKTAREENENLQKKVKEIQETSERVQTFLEQQKNLNFMQQENINKLKQNLKKLKIDRFKYQKLVKNKEMRLSAVLNQNKKLRKTLEATELLYNESVLANQTLQLKENEWRSNFEKHLEEDKTEHQGWEAAKQKMIQQLNEKESEMVGLKEENSRLVLKLTENERINRTEFEHLQNDLLKTLNENSKLKEDVEKLIQENNDKAKVISKFDLSTAGLSSQIDFHKNEAGKLQDVVKKLESQLSEAQKKLACEKAQNKKAASDFNSKLEENLQEANKKISELEKLLEGKTASIEKLESQQNQLTIKGKTALEKLNNELKIEYSKNKELNRNYENMKASYADVSRQLEEAKKQILNLEGKLTDVSLLNEKLNRTQNELEKKSADLLKEIELEKNLSGALEDKQKKAEKELSKLQKTAEENAALKSSAAELKTLLEATEARLEAYKVAVKKLESEAVETKNSHTEEMSKLKLELTRLEEATKRDKFPSATPQNSENSQNKRELRTPKSAPREKSTEPLFSFTLNAKDREPEMGDFEKWRQNASPLQSGKKFLSTPRKVYTSTPQSSFRNSTPTQKKRDPYEFDSDSSIERLDQDKVLKVLNRQKRETANKKSKTNK